MVTDWKLCVWRFKYISGPMCLSGYTPGCGAIKSMSLKFLASQTPAAKSPKLRIKFLRKSFRSVAKRYTPRSQSPTLSGISGASLAEPPALTPTPLEAIAAAPRSARPDRGRCPRTGMTQLPASHFRRLRRNGGPGAGASPTPAREVGPRAERPRALRGRSRLGPALRRSGPTPAPSRPSARPAVASRAASE